MTILSALAETLQIAGAGLIIKPSIDLSLEENASSYNVAALVLGSFMWISGVFLERKVNKNPRQLPLDAGPEVPEKLSTKVIKKFLDVSAGYGLIAGATQFIKHDDTNSANLGLCATGALSLMTKHELKQVLAFLSDPNKFRSGHTLQEAMNEARQEDALSLTVVLKIMRFLLGYIARIGGDLLAAHGLKKAVNNESLDNYDIACIVVGLSMSFAEFLISVKFEKNLSLLSAVTRRLMLTELVVSTVFAIEDLVNARIKDNYNFIDDMYFLIVNSPLIIFTGLEIMNIEKLLTTRENEYLQHFVNSDQFEITPQVDINRGSLTMNTYLNQSPTSGNLVSYNSLFNSREELEVSASRIEEVKSPRLD